MEVFNLFPTPLGIYEIGRNFTSKELKFIKSQKTTKNTGNFVSANNNILDKKELKNIKDFLEEAVIFYLHTIYAPSNDVGLRITQSWCNYTEPGQFHHKHAHPNSFISGVLYIQAEKTVDRIYFFKDAWQQLKTPTKEFNTYNSDSWWMEAYTGRLFLFPSHLVHMVEPSQGGDTRISLSFNTFPVGNFGDDVALTGLTL